MTLRMVQRDGAAWLRKRGRGLLGDVPGAGKTRTLLSAVTGLRTLVVCPAIVREHWRREAAIMGVDIVPKSYNEITLGRSTLMDDLLDPRNGVGAILLDEIHALKNPGAQRTKILLGKHGYIRNFSGPVYGASGTPVLKSPMDLWPILAAMFSKELVERGITSQAEFVRRFVSSYTVWIGRRQVVKYSPTVRNPDEYAELVHAVMLRRGYDELGLDMPALDWQRTLVSTSGPIDDELTPGGYGEGKAEIVHALNADAVGALADIASDPVVARMRRKLGDLKAKLAVELLGDELASGDEKVVVFAYHRDALDILHRGLAPFGVAYVDGDTSETARNAAIDAFQHTAKVRVFLGQQTACKEGITLTAARRVVLVEPDWTAKVNEQLGRRVARFGQTARHCVGQMLVLAGTLDESIVARNHAEVRMADAIGLGET